MHTDTLHGVVRVLVVTNFEPDPAAPHRGRWVMDQVEGIRGHGVEVELFTFPPGSSQYTPATRRLRRLLARERFDLVHAHYGLAGWCAQLAGAKPLIVTFHGTDVRHPVVGPLSRRLARRVRLVAGVSRSLFAPEAGRPGLPRRPGADAVLPCGPDLGRFTPTDRARARQDLGLDPEARLLFFPADPARAPKRHDRAAELAAASDAELLSGGGIEPERMPLWINAADAVVVTSEYEGFGLACLEALACNVPVLSTPVGIAPFALGGVDGCLVQEWDPAAWSATARRILDAGGRRVDGVDRAAQFAAARMADRVVCAYEEILGENLERGQ